MTIPAWLVHITRPIRSDSDHAAAMREIDRLWGSEPGTPDGDRFELIGILVDAYERERWPIRLTASEESI